MDLLQHAEGLRELVRAFAGAFVPYVFGRMENERHGSGFIIMVVTALVSLAIVSALALWDLVSGPRVTWGTKSVTDLEQLLRAELAAMPPTTVSVSMSLPQFAGGQGTAGPQDPGHLRDGEAHR